MKKYISSYEPGSYIVNLELCMTGTMIQTGGTGVIALTTFAVTGRTTACTLSASYTPAEYSKLCERHPRGSETEYATGDNDDRMIGVACAHRLLSSR